MDPITVTCGFLIAVGAATAGLAIPAIRRDQTAVKKAMEREEAYEKKVLETPPRPLINAIVASMHHDPRSWSYDTGSFERLEGAHPGVCVRHPSLTNGDVVILYQGTSILPWGTTLPARVVFTHKEANEVQRTWESVCATHLLDGVLA